MQHNLKNMSASLNNTPALQSISFQELLYFVSCLIAVIINSTASEFRWSVRSKFKESLLSFILLLHFKHAQNETGEDYCITRTFMFENISVVVVVVQSSRLRSF
jgi:hypothetical protein